MQMSGGDDLARLTLAPDAGASDSLLTKLERTGLIEQHSNQRWYAGPLTADRLRDHFEMRWLLEPAALGQAMETLRPAIVASRREHVKKAERRRERRPATLERLEIELHVKAVLSCSNEQLCEAIRRNQLPLIATHSTFAGQHGPDEIETMLANHLAIVDHILAGRKKSAMTTLEEHIRRSLEPNIERLRKLGPLPEGQRPPFLVPAAPAGRRFRGNDSRTGPAAARSPPAKRRPNEQAKNIAR
jgi:DNA-binding GntR family transcriptional regulator